MAGGERDVVRGEELLREGGIAIAHGRGVGVRGPRRDDGVAVR